MISLEILDVAIGMIFVYTLVSVICSSIREGIEAWLKSRAAYLEYGIRELLHDTTAQGIARSIYNHPLINSLFPGRYEPTGSGAPPGIFANGSNLPSYIPAKNFAVTLMDIAARGPDTDAVSSDPSAPVISLESVRANVLNINNEPVQRVLITAIDSAQGDLNKAQANIEDWYNATMDRVSGRYKRATQWILFWIGLVVAVGLNVNTITIADFLYRDDVARAAIVKRVETATADPAFPDLSYEQATKELGSLGLPIGWDAGWGAPRRGAIGGPWNDFFGPILGWLMTALAATMGAPFWFDLLNKIMVIRSTVKPHEKSPEEASEDRQLPAQRPQENVGTGQPPTGGAAGGTSTTAPLFAQPEVVSGASPRDAESSLDGCSVDINDVTPDEELPLAEGGVA
jgi:hypothetical protein